LLWLCLTGTCANLIVFSFRPSAVLLPDAVKLVYPLDVTKRLSEIKTTHVLRHCVTCLPGRERGPPLIRWSSPEQRPWLRQRSSPLGDRVTHERSGPHSDPIKTDPRPISDQIRRLKLGPFRQRREKEPYNGQSRGRLKNRNNEENKSVCAIPRNGCSFSVRKRRLALAIGITGLFRELRAFSALSVMHWRMSAKLTLADGKRRDSGPGKGYANGEEGRCRKWAKDHENSAANRSQHTKVPYFGRRISAQWCC
jgi:hypothetical protein